MTNSNDTALIALVVAKFRTFRGAVWKRVEAAGAEIADLGKKIISEAAASEARDTALGKRVAELENRTKALVSNVADHDEALKALDDEQGEQDAAVDRLRKIVADIAKEQGPIGPMPKHEWSGTKLRFESAPGVWDVWIDLAGADGKPGEMPKHQWNGTKLRFQTAPGKWGPWVDLAGETRVVGFGSGRGGGDGGFGTGGGASISAAINLDGGRPNTVYGGTLPINGGTP
jgi:hypothetical protein